MGEEKEKKLDKQENTKNYGGIKFLFSEIRKKSMILVYIFDFKFLRDALSTSTGIFHFSIFFPLIIILHSVCNIWLQYNSKEKRY